MKGLVKSFGYAFKGIWHAVKTGRNMRIHITVLIYMYCYIGIYDFFPLTRAEIAVTLLASAMVLSAECFNTALERCVDLVTLEYRPLAKRAKDAAAGAVLLCALFAVAVGIAVLGRGEYMGALLDYYVNNPLMLLVLLLSLIPSGCFIFLPGRKKRTAEDSSAE